MKLKVILGAAAVMTVMVWFVPSVTTSQGNGYWRLFKHGDALRSGEVVLPLRDGRVLVTSGTESAARGPLVSTTEIFDPSTGSWTRAADIPVAGTQQSTVELSDGSVLVAGGVGVAKDARSAPPLLADAELFSPATLSWTLVGKLANGRASAALVPRPNGGAMIIGGDGSSSTLSSVEVFNPSNRTWQSAGSLGTPRSSPVAVALRDGSVLVMGGYGPIGADEAAVLQSLYEETNRLLSQGPILTSELYEPASDRWRAYQISFPKQLGQQVVTSAFGLADGGVIGLSTGLIAAAGFGFQTDVPNDRYPFVLDPSTSAITVGPLAPPITVSRRSLPGSALSATGALPDDRLVVSSPERTALYEPGPRTWSVAAASPLKPFVSLNSAIVLSSGHVLVNAADEWALLDPNGTPIQGSSGLMLDSPVLSWWLTIAAVALALMVALQFALSRTAGLRSRQQSR